MRCATAAPSSATPVFVFRKHNLIMTEARILDLLYSLEGKQEPLPKGAQYMAEYVETISKNLATYFHKSAKVQNTSIANKRLDLIQVLQKWCVKKSSHFDINEQNFHCFLNALTKHHVEEWISDFKKELEEEQKQLDATFATELVKFYTSQNEENKRKHETNDEIIKYERQQFLEDNFDFTFSRCIQNDDIESFLNLLILEDKANTNKNEENKTSEIKNKFELTQYRESQINAAYSLLNLEKTDETEVFYLELLTKLKSFKLLNSEELMLLEYLFLKSDFISTNFSEKLLEYFPFIYEKEVIKLCKNAIVNNSIGNLTPISKKLQDLSINNTNLRCNITKIVYELFALSNHNNVVLSLIDLFK